ncbi:MAG TPA: BlaI/MecI/CopY family transcriptional regulator [Lentimicrobium sp.]|nr:BlaI/MecI/CopY family transcriptional regulator [Lentimicrobium sp.]
MKELTRAEEQVMQILWKIGKGYVTDLLEYFPSPKPAYNTVSTIVRILEKKGFVGHEPAGKSYIYFPIVTKTDYSKHSLSQLVKGYFSNSYKQMVSFFSEDDNLSIKDLEEMKALIDKKIQNKKSND